jgi:hypothetical protein
VWTAALLWTADRTDGRRGEGPGMTAPPLAQVPVRSAAELTQRWADLHEAVAEHFPDTTHLAMALCRPGHAVVTAEDDEWAEGLHTVLDDAIESNWSLHLAAGGRVVPVVEPPGWRLATA